MAWTRKQLFFAVLMVITGSINTLTAKWQDELEAVNSADELAHFTHPYFQTDCMFLGELFCLFTFHILLTRRRSVQRKKDPTKKVETVKFPKYIFALPATLDMIATSTMMLGMTLTYASSFQMLRGAVIVFTGLLSVGFLGRRLEYFQWLGIFLVIGGLAIVGASDFLDPSIQDDDNYTLNKIITGDLLIIAAQVVTATQMVVQEKFLSKYDIPPLQAVGWEGFFGFIIMSTLLVPMYWIPAGSLGQNPRGVLEDMVDVFVQLGNNPLIFVPIIMYIISIAFFNFSGVTVTKELSATTRMVLDSIRTLVIWVFSNAIGWEVFNKWSFMQLGGFVVLIFGMMFYNDVVILPKLREVGWVNDGFGPNTTEISTRKKSSSSSASGGE